MELKDLKFQAELAAKLFDEIPASVIVIDKNGVILSVNKNFYNYTNKPARSMVGKNLLDKREIKDPELAEKFSQLLRFGKNFSGHPLKHFAELQGVWYAMSLSAVALKNTQGKVVGAVSIAQDVTLLSQLKQDLELANKKLAKRVDAYSAELLEKKQNLEEALNSRNRFFADASHELRTPLTIIKGNVDLIQMQAEKTPLPKSLQEKIQTIDEEALRMSALLEDITEINRTDMLAHPVLFRERVSLEKVIASEIRDISVMAKQKQIKVKHNLESVEIVGETRALKKLVRNLLSNALRYTKNGGQILVGLKMQNHKAIFTVADTGIGISKEDLPHIFRRFYRAGKVRNRVDGGSGLGLPICQRVVTQHGGEISVVSKLGKGTKFTVVLPI